MSEIDLSRLLQSEECDEEILGQIGIDIYNGLKTDHYVILRNSKLRDSNLARSLNTVKGFFDLPETTKLKFAYERINPNRIFGYHGVPKLSADTIGDRDAISVLEAIEFHPDDGAKYSSEIPQMEEDLCSSWEQCKALSEKIMQCIALKMKKDKDFFKESFAKKETHSFRCACYPELDLQALPDGFTWFREHTDYAIISFVMPQAGTEGLQVEHPTRGWVEPGIDEDSVVLIAGDAMEYWTDGEIKAANHKVTFPAVQKDMRERWCQIFFHVPDDDALLQPIDEAKRKDGPFLTFKELFDTKSKEENPNVY